MQSIPIKWLWIAAEAFIFSSFFLAFCAVGMVYLTTQLFQLPHSASLAAFTFFGTVCSYNFHWYFTPASFGGSRKTAWSVQHKSLHAVLFLVGLAGAAFAAWELRTHWVLLGITAFLTFLYSAPKIPHRAALLLQKIAIGKTIFLAAAWTHITALLPLWLHSATIGNAAVLYVVNRFFFIYAICILFDYRDRESDRREGIRSLLTKLEHDGIRRLFWSSIGVFGVSSVLLSRFDFSWTAIAALLLPGVAVAALWPYAIRSRSDYLYYFVLDGLMAASLPLLLFLNSVNR